MFGGNSLHQFIQDYQDCLEQLEDQPGDLVMMTNCMVHDLQVTNQVYHQDLRRLERLINKLLIKVMVLEGCDGNLIEIPDSLALILILSVCDIYGHKISLSYHFNSSYTPIHSLHFL